MRQSDGDARDARESPSGAMGTGRAAGTPGGPVPRTDAADGGTEVNEVNEVNEAARAREASRGVPRGDHVPGGQGDGMRTGGSAGTASGQDPTPQDRDVDALRADGPGTDRTRGDGAGTV